MADIGYLILGAVAGILSGLFGIGGGIVMVPSLILFFGLDILDANSISLAAMLLPVGALGVWAYYKAGYINVKDSLWISLGLFLGSFIGGELAVTINEKLLTNLYVAILFYIALSYLDVFKYFKKEKVREETNGETISRPLILYILVGLAAGAFAGLFGKGGGIIIVPMLVGIFHYNAKAAAATSLAALQLPVGLPSVIVYAQNGHFHLLPAILIAVGIIIGAFFGSKLAVKLPTKTFKGAFAVFLIVVAIFMLTKH